MGENKDWLDALREMDFSEGASPSPASWEAVGRRVRRAAAIRRAGLTAAALVPVAALLLWAPWHRLAQPGPAGPAVTQAAPAPDTAVTPAPVILTPSPLSPSLSSASQSGAKESSRPRRLTLSAGGTKLADAVVPTPSDTDIPDPVGNLSPFPDNTPAVPEETPVAPDGKKESAPVEPFDESVFYDAPRPQRTRVAVGVRGGADLARRQADVSTMEYPTLMAMNFANTLDPSLVDYVKSNSGGNLYGYFTENGMMDHYSMNSGVGSAHYRHDLPLTLGLSVRADLTPRIGLESGLEYSYLHSVEFLDNESLDQRLHFIGIPLRSDFRIWSGDRFDLYAGLGGKVEKCVYAILGRVQSDEKQLQWSAEAFAGAQYRLGRRTCLYLQPELSYYFTRTGLVTCRTEHPLNVSLHAGLRFEL